MRYYSPRERRQRMVRALLAFSVTLGIFVLIMQIDHPIWRALILPQHSWLLEEGANKVTYTQGPSEWMRSRDWYQVLRQMGSLFTWALIAGAMLLHDFGVRGDRWSHGFAWWRRGVLLFVAPVVAGVIAEGLRVILRRQRPGLEGIHEWGWPWGSAAWEGSWGLPSSHAAVAFAGAFMLMRLFPSIWPIVLPWAIGCGVTRMIVGAHFASDIFAGAAVGFFVVHTLQRTLRASPFRSRLAGPTISFE
jgi:membrane-associated phospholipid phosphatase